MLNIKVSPGIQSRAVGSMVRYPQQHPRGVQGDSWRCREKILQFLGFFAILLSMLCVFSKLKHKHPSTFPQLTTKSYTGTCAFLFSLLGMFKTLEIDIFGILL